MNNSLIIATDGSCYNKIKVGGSGAVIYNNGSIVRRLSEQTPDKNFETGEKESPTNNRAELYAIYIGLMEAQTFIDNRDDIWIITDSEYSMNLITKYCKNKTIEEIKNKYKNSDLIILLKNLIESIKSQGKNIKMIHINSHLSNKKKSQLSELKQFIVNLNEIADELSDYKKFI